MFDSHRVTLGVVLTLLQFASASAEGAADQGPPRLSLQDAVRLSIEHVPAIRGAKSRVDAARAAAGVAASPLNPSVSVQHGVGANVGGLDEDLVLLQPIELRARRRPRADAASADVRQAGANLDVERQRIRLDVTRAYYATLAASELYRLAEQNAMQAAELSRLAQAQFEHGEIPRSQLIRIELDAAAEQRARFAAEASLRTQRRVLASFVGEEKDWLLSDSLPDQLPATSIGDLLNRVDQRPELRSTRAHLEALRARVRSASSASSPELFVAGTLGNFTQGGVGFRVGVTFPAFDRGILRAGRAEARAEVRAGEEDVAEMMRELRREIEVAYLRAAAAQEVVRRIRAEEMPRALRLIDMSKEAFQAGLASYLEVLDSQRSYRLTASALVQARLEFADAEAELEQTLHPSVEGPTR